ncbi:3086_t:CDS:2, partial [Dentiscutata heterogama]
MPKRTTLTAEQKNELCAYALDKSTISRILKTSEERLGNGISNSKTKRHRAVTYPELDLALKEFVLIYQHRTVLTDALLVKKVKNQNGIRLQQLQEEAVSADM